MHRPIGPYQRLNPLTKLIAAVVVPLDAITLGGVAGPVGLLLVGVLVPAMVAGLLPRLLRLTLLLALPLALSAAIVNVLFLPTGAHVVAQIGPIRVTQEGVALAAEVEARVAIIAASVVLFYLTTDPRDLVVDFERRGVPARLLFVAYATVRFLPSLAERVTRVQDAQRARGLDTEGSVFARIRGIVPLAGPVVLGALAEVERRTLALESRAFSRPGRRTLLDAPPDSAAQSTARWFLLATIPLTLAARVAIGRV